jgi:hypothetical protein
VVIGGMDGFSVDWGQTGYNFVSMEMLWLWQSAGQTAESIVL